MSHQEFDSILLNVTAAARRQIFSQVPVRSLTFDFVTLSKMKSYKSSNIDITLIMFASAIPIWKKTLDGFF
jgi:hypothetical protein